METPYEQMDDLGGKNPYFWFNTHLAEYLHGFLSEMSFPRIFLVLRFGVCLVCFWGPNTEPQEVAMDV